MPGLQCPKTSVEPHLPRGGEIHGAGAKQSHPPIQELDKATVPNWGPPNIELLPLSATTAKSMLTYELNACSFHCTLFFFGLFVCFVS